jgi:hypothetical protein
MLLIPVLYVNQEMVVRLGAMTGVGHARLIFERFGRFWGSSAPRNFALRASRDAVGVPNSGTGRRDAHLRAPKSDLATTNEQV